MALQVPGTSVEPPPVSLAKATATVAVASPPSQSPAAPSQPPSSAGNNSLYLFTFLTTLLLLLAVSCGIIFRSFILRRRFRRRMEEAMAAGILPTDGPYTPEWTRDGRTRPRVVLGQKPSLWDVSLRQRPIGALQNWDSAIPVSATIVRKQNGESEDADTPIPPAVPLHRLLAPARLAANIFGRRRSQVIASTDPPTSDPSHPTDIPINEVASPPLSSSGQVLSPVTSDSRKVVISVLIAMPDASRPSYVPHYVRSTDNALQAPDHATDSESQRESEKGKSKAPNHSNADGVQGDGELPDVLFGIFESDWKGSQGSKDGHDTLSAKPNDV